MRIERALTTIVLLPLLAACTSSDSLDGSAGAAQAPRLSDAALEAGLARGRALLDAGQADEAEPLFAELARADGNALRARMWLLRAWMDQGKSNDTLDALDELNRAGERGLDMNYLYGMAFARRAEGYLADGVADSSVQMNYIDATAFLKEALDADPVRYHDAYLPLARASWYVQELETARWAADHAVETLADSPEAWLVRGRIAMTQFLSAEGEEPGSAQAEAEWSVATQSFARAVELYAAPSDPVAQASKARAASELGTAMLWRAKGAEATDAYATASAWDPQGFDYAQALGSLAAAPADDERPSGFRALCEEALARLTARGAAQDPRAATLLWWLGYARFADADWNGSEEAFQAALALAPESTNNSWFYIGLARHYRKDHEGALAAMHAGWNVDPTSMVETAAGAGGALRAFEGLLGWCAQQEPPRNLDAAFLSELLAAAMPGEPRHWNNLGLFLRDEGERLEIDAYRNKTEAPDAALLADLYGRSFRAYRRALELNPEDPQLINDTALMLDYHLDGDPAEVEQLYRHALALVEARLAAGDLSADDRARFEQTKSDIGVNLKRLLEPEAEEEEEPAQGQGTAAAASTSGGG